MSELKVVEKKTVNGASVLVDAGGRSFALSRGVPTDRSVDVKLTKVVKPTKEKKTDGGR